MKDKKLCRAWITEDAHKIAKSEASLEGIPLSQWLDDIVKKESSKKGRGKNNDMHFF